VHRQIGEFALQQVKVRGNQRAHARIFAARVDEREDHGLAAEIRKAETARELIEELRLRHHVADLERLDVVHGARDAAGDAAGNANVVQTRFVSRKIGSGIDPVAGL